MTEADWLTCADPDLLLKFLLRKEKAGSRRRLAFVINCGYQVQHLFDAQGLKALRYAEARLLNKVPEETIDFMDVGAPSLGVTLQLYLVHPPADVSKAAGWVGTLLISELEHGSSSEKCEAICAAATMEHVQFIRDIWPNPFRHSEFDPVWLRHRDGMILPWAQSILEKKRFGDLPYLADALEEAGCDQEEILEHCRAERQHYPGCWVVEGLLQLGRQKSSEPEA